MFDSYVNAYVRVMMLNVHGNMANLENGQWKMADFFCKMEISPWDIMEHNQD